MTLCEFTWHSCNIGVFIRLSCDYVVFLGVFVVASGYWLHRLNMICNPMMMYCGCTVDVLWVYCGCTADVLWMYCGCTVGVLWMYCGCTVGVLWMYCGCTADVLWVYCGCTADVLWM